MKKIQNKKNPHENPYQPMDFKNLDHKPDFCQMFVIVKKKSKCKRKPWATV